jgi:hypothetical protein
VEEPAGSTGVEEFNTDGTETTDPVERRIEETLDRMLALRGTPEEATFTLEMLRHGGRSEEALRVPGVLAVSSEEALRGHGVLAVSSQLLDVFGLRHIVASLDHASVSLRGQC